MMPIKVTDANFKEQLQKYDQVMVKYYVDWCGTCKLVAPKYKRIAEEEQFKQITFLEINAEENLQASQEADVNYFPTFAIFSKGKLVDTIKASEEEAIRELVEKLN